MSELVDSLIERAAAELPGVSDALLVAEARALVHDFCVNTRAWQVAVTGLSTDPDTGTLDVQKAPVPGEVLGVIGPLRYGQRRIHPQPDLFELPIYTETSAQPTHYLTVPPTTTLLTFFPHLSPEVTLSGISAQLFLAPTQGATLSFPDQLYSNFGEGLLAGLTGRMMLKAKKPWSDTKLGAVRMAEYRMSANKARHQANKGRSTSPEHWRYPGWA